MHTGPVGRWPGVIMARCCMPRRGAAAGVLLILCSVLRLRPLVGIQLQLSFDCGVVRIHRHGMGEAPSKAPRLVRAAEFRSRGGDDSTLSARPPLVHASDRWRSGSTERRQGELWTAITLQVYCDAPALETRTPTASQRHRPRGTRPRPSAVRAALHRIDVRCGRCPTQRHPTGGKSGVNL